MENGLDVDKAGACKVEGHSGAVKFFYEQGYVETVGVESGYVGFMENFGEASGELAEGGFAGHVSIGDVMYGGGFGGDGHLGVDAACALKLVPVGPHLDHRDFDYAVAGYVGSGGLEIEEHYRTRQIQFHQSTMFMGMSIIRSSQSVSLSSGRQRAGRLGSAILMITSLVENVERISTRYWLPKPMSSSGPV